jgi:sigma-B regulation protein RsbU (phosphoserine phosphatase)
VPGFAVTGHSIPAGSVGGDWYDFVPLSDGRWGLVLADVAGKGTAAALLMAATRGILRSLAEAECSPGEVLTKLNRLLVEDLPPARFVTMIYGVLDPASRTFAFANAGHLPPVLVNEDGARLLSTEKGMPLGLTLGSFSECTVSLGKGSRLLLYSDGITEATNANDEEYGAHRLMSHLAKSDASLESIFADVHAFTNGTGLYDDATAINIVALV